MNITIVGTGYVGLVTGTCFAEMGNQVTCVDIDQEKVAKLRQGELPIYEPDLEHYFARNRKEDRLHFTTDLEETVPDAEIIFLALPTPPGEDGAADLSYVMEAAGDVADLLAAEGDPDYRVIVNKSTVPVGTAGASALQPDLWRGPASSTWTDASGRLGKPCPSWCPSRRMCSASSPGPPSRWREPTSFSFSSGPTVISSPI